MPEFLKNVEVSNRKAFHDYNIHDKLECGIVLLGSEVKSIRRGGANLRHAYALFRGDELFVLSMNVSQYHESGREGHDPGRPRKLLAHKNELLKLRQKSEEKGWTLIPLRLYFVKGKVKVEIGLGQGKREYDKRESIKKRDEERERRRERF